MASDYMGNIKDKLKKKYPNVLGEGIEIRQHSWIKKQAEEYMDETKKETESRIESNIDVETSYPQYSMAIEKAINEIQKKKEYTFLKRILVIRNPYKYAPLCALAVFHTDDPYKVKVLVKGKTSDCDFEYETGFATDHRVPIMGLYPDYENTVVLTVFNKKGKTEKVKQFKLSVPPLKGKNSEVKVNREIAESKYVYDFTLVYGGDDGIFPYVFDRNGDIRFAFSIIPKTYGFQPIDGGRFLFLSRKITRLTCTNPTSTQFMEVDQMGRIYNIYNVEKGAHHDFCELKNGNLAMGSNAISGTTFEDSVIELDRKTGQVVKEILLKDYLDSKYVDSSDWAHLNTIQLNEDEHTLMVCLRNLHSVVKIDYETKELLWILCHPLFWKGSTVEDKVLKPTDENIEWFFQPHAAYILDEDIDGNPDTKHLIIYDNHTQARRSVDYYDDDKRSFVKIYTINEKEKTVNLLKSYPLQRTNIRSNAIYEAKEGKVLAMSGKIKSKDTERRGSVVEFDFDTGRELNRYVTNFGYYRAYPFEFAVDEMCKSMEINTNYELGKNYELKSISSIDVSSAKELPEPVLEECYATEEDRQNKLMDVSRENLDLYVDPEQDMIRIKMKIIDDMLYITLIDHLLLGIYFVGEKNCYLRDFSDTKQERPEYFNRANTTDPICLSDMEEDNYQIYYKHENGLYRSKYYFNIHKK